MSIQDSMSDKDENNATADASNDEGENKEDGAEGGKDSDKEAEEAKDGEGDEEKKPKIDPKDWPLRDIKEPTDNDVLFGRGGEYFFTTRSVVATAIRLLSHRVLLGYNRRNKSC